MIYLASPYTSPEPQIRRNRYELAVQATTNLMAKGHKVFSPIVHSHPLAEQGLPGDIGFWWDWCQPFLDICESIVVLTIDGWHLSKGILKECKYMQEHDRLITFASIEDTKRGFFSLAPPAPHTKWLETFF